MSISIADNPTQTLAESSKKADLAGPGIGDYNEIEKILPRDYNPLLNAKETQQAIFQVKRYIEDNLCKELSLMMVEVPLIVDAESGFNDMLDRDGCGGLNYLGVDRMFVAKWKRMALKQFDCRPWS
jgi:aspartate--ammonia ligase